MINWPPTYPTDKEWKIDGPTNRIRRNTQLGVPTPAWTITSASVEDTFGENRRYNRVIDNSASFGRVWQTETGRTANDQRYFIIAIRKDNIGRATRFPLIRINLSGGTGSNHDLRVDTSDGTFSTAVTSGVGTVGGGVIDMGDYWQFYLDSTDAGGNTNVEMSVYPAVGASETWTYSSGTTGSIDVLYVGVFDDHTSLAECQEYASRHTNSEAPLERGTDDWFGRDWDNVPGAGGTAEPTGIPQYDYLQMMSAYYEGDMSRVKGGFYTQLYWDRLVKDSPADFGGENGVPYSASPGSWTETGTGFLREVPEGVYGLPQLYRINKNDNNQVQVFRPIETSVDTGNSYDLTLNGGVRIAPVASYFRFYLRKNEDTQYGAPAIEVDYNDTTGRICIDMATGSFSSANIVGTPLSNISVTEVEGWWKIDFQFDSAFSADPNQSIILYPRYRDDAANATTPQTGTPGSAVWYAMQETQVNNDLDTLYTPNYTTAVLQASPFPYYMNRYNNFRYVLGVSNYDFS